MAKNLPRSLALLAVIVLVISWTVRAFDRNRERLSNDLSGRPAFQLDVNTATAAQLSSIPGVGPKMARQIAQYREQNGHFENLNQLLEIEGVGPATLETLTLYLIAD